MTHLKNKNFTDDFLCECHFSQSTFLYDHTIMLESFLFDCFIIAHEFQFSSNKSCYELYYFLKPSQHP